MNRLAKEKSPYLRHASNQKIQWYPWSEEAFQKAAELDRPVFLSSGAVWCHWCHVMAKESFDDDEVARILNEHYVAIKLDRDERPDLDRRYQNAVSAMGGGGGWPLSVFMSPGGIPFHGGTYYPPEDRMGMPGFKKVLIKVAEFYHAHREKVAEHSDKVMRVLSRQQDPPGEIEKSLVDGAIDRILSDFDADQGGFGDSPKFPMTSAIDLLTGRYFFSRDPRLEEVIRKTLTAMAKGGFCDQIGGGFHRYSVDGAWTVPHFEKMANDNAGLLVNYLNGYSLFREPLFRETAWGIIDFLRSTLSGNDGGFYSSQDADVLPDDEGGYFTWTEEEIRSTLTDREYEVIKRHLTGERGRTHHDSAKMVLYISEESSYIAEATGIPVEEVKRIIVGARKKLLEARKKRQEPFVDRTLYTSINGMLISSYLKAFSVFRDPSLMEFALKSIKKIRSLLYRDGRLLHAEHVDGMLDDYVHFIDCLITAYEATADSSHMELADELMRDLLIRFWDSDSGGFFDTKTAVMGIRLKTIEDIPHASSNATGIICLLKLFQITDNERYRQYAVEAFRAFSSVAEKTGIHASSFFMALDRFFSMLSLKVGESQRGRLSDTAFSTFRPYTTIRYEPKKDASVVPCTSDRCYQPIRDSAALKKFMEAPVLPENA
jgi:uncharacterized protein YyaL (SSP411 family)